MTAPGDAAPTPRRKLGEILVAGGAISPEQLSAALAAQTENRLPLGQTLLGLGFVTDEVMRRALGTQLGVPYLDLDNVVVDRALADAIDHDYALAHLVMPIARVGAAMTVAMDDPTQTAVIDELRRTTGCSIAVVTSSAAAIRHTLQRLYDSLERGSPGHPRPSPDVPEFVRRRGTSGSSRRAPEALLGLPAADFAGLAATIEAGLPVSAIDRLAGNTGLDAGRIAKLLRLTPELRAARQATGRLTPAESDLLLTLAHLHGLALDLFGGDPALATAWLESRQPTLNGAVPFEAARMAVGAREVEAILRALRQPRGEAGT